MVKLYTFVIFKKRGRKIYKLGSIWARNKHWAASGVLKMLPDDSYTCRVAERGFGLLSHVKPFIKSTINSWGSR